MSIGPSSVKVGLLPRLKGIHRQRRYRPTTGAPDAYPALQAVLTRPIDWALAEPAWMARMGPDERRGLTSLAWGHVNPYGLFRLDMAARLPLDMPTTDDNPDQLLFQGV